MFEAESRRHARRLLKAPARRSNYGPLAWRLGTEASTGRRVRFAIRPPSEVLTAVATVPPLAVTAPSLLWQRLAPLSWIFTGLVD
jgi:hypothetical protein